MKDLYADFVLKKIKNRSCDVLHSMCEFKLTQFE